MAVVLAEFLHFFPGYTAESVLRMPWRRFMVLYLASGEIQAAEELRQLEALTVAAHPGKNAESYKGLFERIRDRLPKRHRAAKVDTLTPNLHPLVSYEIVPGSIEAERQRQRDAWEKMQAERRRQDG